MNRQRQPTPIVLQLIGRSGTGKTTVAVDLRQRFGLPVLELGPLYRLAAVIAAQRSHRDLRVAAVELERRVVAGDIHINLHTAGSFAANEILVHDREIDQMLWNERLGPLVVEAAENRLVRLTIARVSKHLLDGVGPAIVTGREPLVGRGGQYGPLVELNADASVRHARKRDQLGSNSLRAASAFEPRSPLRPWHRRSVIDTSDVRATEVGALVAQHLRRGANPSADLLSRASGTTFERSRELALQSPRRPLRPGVV
jgi:cytidylate kinase